MKNITVTSLIAAIIGGIYLKTFFPILLIIFYIIDTRFKNSFLFLFTIYMLIFGYFFNPSDFSILLIINMIVIPHLIILFELLHDIKQKYDKIDIIIILCLISGIVHPEIYIFGIVLLLIKRFNNFLNKKIGIILIPIIISLLIFIKHLDMLNQNLIYKILVLTGLGVILYAIYSFLNKSQEI
ncbi:hypothetical protein GYY_01800 [Methanococcus maripaludis X1]|uniref:Uncharacterized protein n=1 Tax=Methanococcus maripaludis X1 TaxID=1053692 RepID=G0H2P8_METMI|nr:hypothetical protein [Methanococcus maripaludis]AEK19247.1 hypothetical protein GYY_01800 [Methanococcus maripaludis X1]